MRKGFTLVEMLVVVALLAILVSVSIPVITSINSKAGDSADAITAESIETAIDSWMDTDYSDDNFYRTNLYTSAATGEAAAARIGGLTEQMYSYNFAGTGQLPGVELTDEAQIRHSVITAIKATSSIKILIRDGQQYVQSPQTGSQYGFKYYYKIGRVNAELIDSAESALGNDEVYRYYVWLDRNGGVIDSTTVPKSYKNSEYLYVGAETLCSLTFDYGSYNRREIRIVVEQEGKLSHTFDGIAETAPMFKPGVYNIYFYENGDLVSTKLGVEIRSSGQEISIQ